MNKVLHDTLPGGTRLQSPRARLIGEVSSQFGVRERIRQCTIMPALSNIGLRPQPIDATQALNLSAGVSNSNVCRGRSLS
jgi:hypothetical protein